MLSGEAFAGLNWPEDWLWFQDFARARQLERIDPAKAQRYLLSALAKVVHPEDRYSLLASHCDHCLNSGLELPRDHLEELMVAVRNRRFAREALIDKLYVACMCLQELGDGPRLAEMTALLCKTALTPPSEDDVRELLETEEAEMKAQGPLLELLREGEAPLKTLQYQRGRYWFSGFEMLMTVVLTSADFIRDDPPRWAFLKPCMGQWMEEYRAFLARHGQSLGDQETMLREVLSLLE